MKTAEMVAMAKSKDLEEVDRKRAEGSAAEARDISRLLSDRMALRSIGSMNIQRLSVYQRTRAPSGCRGLAMRFSWARDTAFGQKSSGGLPGAGAPVSPDCEALLVPRRLPQRLACR